jgi:hypothetical protein
VVATAKGGWYTGLVNLGGGFLVERKSESGGPIAEGLAFLQRGGIQKSKVAGRDLVRGREPPQEKGCSHSRKRVSMAFRKSVSVASATPSEVVEPRSD